MTLRAFFPFHKLPAAALAALLIVQISFAAQAGISTNKDNLTKMLSTTDPTDGHVAEIEAELLQTWHFSQHPFDREIAGKFLDRYLDTLDYSHLYFLKSDLNEFDTYRTNLQQLTIRDHNVSPCWNIFARFMERADQHTSFVTNVLEKETFEFTNHERYVINRHALPNPKDLNDAHQVWHEELRAEYLQHLLSSPDIEFTGPVQHDSKGRLVVAVTAEPASYEGSPVSTPIHAQNPSDGKPIIRTSDGKTIAPAFAELPTKLFSKDRHQIAWLEAGSTATNALLHLDISPDQILKRTTNHFYSAKGEDLGDISFHRLKVEGTNSPPVAKSALTVTNFEGIVHLNKKDLVAIHNYLTNHYDQVLKNYKELDRDRVLEIYLNSLARAYDPHSDYMGHMTAENFNIQMKLSLFGIGAILTSKDEYCTISELKEGPAMRSGKINPGDRIVAVAQSNSVPVDVRGMPLDKVVEMIRGPKGTEVHLSILPAAARDPSTRKEITLVRDEIKLEDQAAKAMLYETPAPERAPLRVGVIDLSSFYANNDSDLADTTGAATVHSTSADVARLVKRLKQEHVDGIILDLRKNGGGYLEEAIKLTSLFIPSGPVVQTKDPNGDIVTDRCLNRTVLYDGPLIVLTSRPYTASASEIFAGAIQDYNRGLIVGDSSTFGKGTVQTMQGLKTFLENQHLSFDYDPGDLKITIKKFYRAGGLSTQLKGVVSDIQLPSVWDYATNEVGESSLPNPLPCDEVASADPENLNRVSPYLPELQRRSKDRVGKQKDFAYIQQDIAQYLKEQADKSVSLNKDERLIEQKADANRAEARRHELLSRKKPDDKVYEITLKNINQPTLEPPAIKTNTVAAVSEPDLDDDGDTEAAKEPPINVDPQLDEARRIMQDYVALYKGGAVAKAPLTSAP